MRSSINKDKNTSINKIKEKDKNTIHHYFLYIRAFPLACTKVLLCFNIRIYFFYFTYSLFKTLYIRLFILHYISTELDKMLELNKFEIYKTQLN